jgi:hypothetical protein
VAHVQGVDAVRVPPQEALQALNGNFGGHDWLAFLAWVRQSGDA